MLSSNLIYQVYHYTIGALGTVNGSVIISDFFILISSIKFEVVTVLLD